MVNVRFGQEKEKSIEEAKIAMEIDAQNYAKLREKAEQAVKVSLRKTEESDNKKKLQIKEDWSKLISKASTTDEKLNDDTGLDGKHLNKQEKDKKKDTKLDDSETGSQQIIIENELKLEKEKKDTKQPKKSNELIHNKQIKNDKKKQIKQDEIRGLHSNQIIDNDLKLEKVKKKEERLKLAEETLKREFRNKALEKQQEKLRREEIQKKKNF